MPRNGMEGRLMPLLKYPGAKWTLAPWIAAHFPAHRTYLEPYFGSGAVLFAKPPSRAEIVNDLDDEIVNLFRAIRDRPADLARAVALTPWAREEFAHANAEPDVADEVERARLFLVRCWQQIGSRTVSRGCRGTWRNSHRQDHTGPWRSLPERVYEAAERLARVQIEHKPALDVIAAHASPDVLVYADPPYPLATRSRRQYRHEMTDEDHADLLAALDRHPGPVLLSGYRCALYDERLARWTRVDKAATAERGLARVESLWLNPVAARSAGGQLRIAV